MGTKYQPDQYLRDLCENQQVSLELVMELIKIEKTNLGNKGASHRVMIETAIKSHLNK